LAHPFVLISDASMKCFMPICKPENWNACIIIQGILVLSKFMIVIVAIHAGLIIWYVLHLEM
jgi:hypothetical protein